MSSIVKMRRRRPPLSGLGASVEELTYSLSSRRSKAMKTWARDTSLPSFALRRLVISAGNAFSPSSCTAERTEYSKCASTRPVAFFAELCVRPLSILGGASEIARSCGFIAPAFMSFHKPPRRCPDGPAGIPGDGNYISDNVIRCQYEAATIFWPQRDNLRFGLSPIDSDIFAGGNPRRHLKA